MPNDSNLWQVFWEQYARQGADELLEVETSESSQARTEQLMHMYMRYMHEDITRERAPNSQARAAISQGDVWVSKNGDVKPISELSTVHLKRILNGLNMGKRYYSQQHKDDAIAAEYKKRLQ